MVRPTINSEKHIVQFGFNNADIGTPTRLDFVKAVATPSNADEVRVGAVVKAVYVEMWYQGEGMATGTSISIIEKRPLDNAGANTAQMLALDSYPNKKNIFWTHQGLSSDQNTNAVPVIRGWLKIPKGKQRFGLGDILGMSMQAQVDGFNTVENL